jgi:IS605 OrfB family transposase
MKITKTLKSRIRDKHRHSLNQDAMQVNFVWNYLNELSHRFIREQGQFKSAFDLQKYTDRAGKLLGLHSHTVQEVGKEYVIRRKQFKKAKLKWRKSRGVKRSLGWIPVKTGAAKWKSGQVFFNGKYYKIWDSHNLSQHKFRSASFSEDSRGRWYFNVVVEIETAPTKGKASIGIDLGCKEAATDSNGDGVTGREYRKLEQKLGLAQRARNKQRVKSIHAKITNRRKDSLHKYSKKLVEENAAIFVGNVSSQALVKTKMAKSVLDAGWSTFKTMLEYKCANADVVFDEVNESYSTQTCSCCGCISASSPKGRAGLRIRDWTCDECGTTHDRDINASKNILAAGLSRLAGEKVAD